MPEKTTSVSAEDNDVWLRFQTEIFFYIPLKAYFMYHYQNCLNKAFQKKVHKIGFYTDSTEFISIRFLSDLTEIIPHLTPKTPFYAPDICNHGPPTNPQGRLRYSRNRLSSRPTFSYFSYFLDVIILFPTFSLKTSTSPTFLQKNAK